MLYTVLQWGFTHQDLREETTVCLIRSSIPLPRTVLSTQYMFNEYVNIYTVWLRRLNHKDIGDQ